MHNFFLDAIPSSGVLLRYRVRMLQKEFAMTSPSWTPLSLDPHEHDPRTLKEHLDQVVKYNKLGASDRRKPWTEVRRMTAVRVDPSIVWSRATESRRAFCIARRKRKAHGLKQAGQYSRTLISLGWIYLAAALCRVYVVGLIDLTRDEAALTAWCG